MDSTMKKTGVANNAVRRKLGAIELMHWVVNKRLSTNLVIHSRIKGKIPEKNLARALAHVQKKHPLLNTRIVGRGWWGASYRSSRVPEIPLTVKRIEMPEWTAYAEKELDDKFDQRTGPPARCRLLRYSETGSILLLTLDHAVADGYSGICILRDVMRYVTGIDGEPDDAAQYDSPMERSFPENGKGLTGWRRFARFAAGTLNRNSSIPVADTGSGRASGEKPGKNIFVNRELPPALVKKLADASKKRGMSVHAVLQAVNIKALAAIKNIDRSARFTLSHVINLRKYLNPQVGDDVGLFFSGIATNHVADAKTNVFSLAEHIQLEMKDALSRDEHFIGYPYFLKMMNSFLKIFGNGSLGSGIYFKMFQAFTGGLQMSNLGAVTIDRKYGAVLLDKIGFVATQTSFRELIYFIAMFNGRMSINLVGVEPYFTRKEIENVVDSFVGILTKEIS